MPKSKKRSKRTGVRAASPKPPQPKKASRWTVVRAVAGVALIVAMAGLALAISISGPDPADDDKATTNSQEQVAEPSPFGEFPAQTDAERELEAMLAGPEDQIDLALANWLIVADLPAYQDMTREQYFRMLDQAINRVRGMIEQARRNPLMAGDLNDPSRLAHVYCSAIIALGIDYKEEFKRASDGPTDASPIYRDANNVFLAGLLRTSEGTCVSMPMLYLVIGERLDLPVHLVTVGQHFFIRWDEPRWRMNIETTIVDTVAMTPGEDNYLEVELLTREQLKGYDDLKNLSKRAVVGKMLHTRCAYYWVQGPEHQREFWRDLNRARALAPNDRNIALHYKDITERIEANRREQAMIQRPRRQSNGRMQPWVPNPRPPMPNVPNPRPPSPFGY